MTPDQKRKKLLLLQMQAQARTQSSPRPAPEGQAATGPDPLAAFLETGQEIPGPRQVSADGATAAEREIASDAFAARAAGPRTGLSLKAAQGIPLAGEWLDEGVGMIDPQQGEQMRAIQRGTEEIMPKAAMAAEIGGGIAASAPFAIGLAGKALQGGTRAAQVLRGAGAAAAAGGIEGAVAGAGAANEGNRAAGALFGGKGIHGLNLGVASVSTALTTTVLKNNQFLLDAASAQQALYINCGWNRWNIIGGFVNGTTAAVFHFTNYNEGKTLNIEGVGFEQAVADGKFLYLEDTSGNEMQNLNIDGAQFTGNPAGAEHVHIELERVRRTVLRGCNTQADQTASNWTLKMDANCRILEADAGCRFMDFPLNLGASLSIHPSIDREQIIFPNRKIITPFALSGYNGNSFSSGTATLDMSALITGGRYPTHGVPPKGYTLLVTARDSASASSAYRRVEFGATTGTATALRSKVLLDKITNDQQVTNTIYVDAHTDGSIALEVFASGTGTLDLWIYLLEIHN